MARTTSVRKEISHTVTNVAEPRNIGSLYSNVKDVSDIAVSALASAFNAKSRMGSLVKIARETEDVAKLAKVTAIAILCKEKPSEEGVVAECNRVLSNAYFNRSATVLIRELAYAGGMLLHVETRKVNTDMLIRTSAINGAHAPVTNGHSVPIRNGVHVPIVNGNELRV